jgi:hypothetical protein
LLFFIVGRAITKEREMKQKKIQKRKQRGLRAIALREAIPILI